LDTRLISQASHRRIGGSIWRERSRGEADHWDVLLQQQILVTTPSELDVYFIGRKRFHDLLCLGHMHFVFLKLMSSSVRRPSRVRVPLPKIVALIA